MDDRDIVMYTVKDIQNLFRCGRDKAYALMQTGGFPSIKIGAQYLVEKTALEKWLKTQQGRHVIV